MSPSIYVSLFDENRILHFHMEEGGSLQPRGAVETPRGPAPLAFDPHGRWLYAGTRGDHRVVTYQVATDGGLTLRGDISTHSDPCFLAVDRSGGFLFSAYHQDGAVAVHQLRAGEPAEPPVHLERTGPTAHCILPSPDNRFVLVPHTARGPNRIYRFGFDPGTGRLTAADPPWTDPPAGVGPRHLVFHPLKPLVYVSNEQGSSMSTYAYVGQGLLRLLDTRPTLPPDFVGDNSCAQIHLRPDATAVYVSTRGHNSIAWFPLDAAGMPMPGGHTPAPAVPRAFCVEPAGRFLLAAGLDTGTLAIYRLDERGEPHHLAEVPVGKKPMWVTASAVR